jgi:hypothetical protein
MKSAFCAALALGSTWLGNARAAESDRPVAPEASRESNESRFRLRLVAPLWLPLLSAQSSATSADLETENLDLESEVNWIVIGVLETGYRPLIARVDVFGIGFGDQVVRRNGESTELAFDSSGFVGRAVLMYEIGPWKFGRHDRRREFTLAPLAGARYNRIGLETGEPTNWSGRYQWVDPVVGARTELTLGDFRLGTHVDFGGFGVSSDIAFWASATVEYLVTDWFSIWLGWQHYQVLFDDVTEQGEHRIRLYLTGPSAGVSLNLF